MSYDSDANFLHDLYRWEANQTPENEPPINEYDPRYDAWIFDDSIGANE